MPTTSYSSDCAVTRGYVEEASAARAESSWSCPSWARETHGTRRRAAIHVNAAMLRMLSSSPNGHRRTGSIKRPLARTHNRAAAGGRRRLGYAGGTRRSAQSVGLDAVKTVLRQVFGCTNNAVDNCVDDGWHDRGRVADAADRRLDRFVRFVMIEISRAVRVSRALIAVMRMHVDSKIIVKVNRPAQHRCRLRHEAAGRHRLRDGNHRSLLYKCTHRHQHHGTGDPSQARVEAQSHRDL